MSKPANPANFAPANFASDNVAGALPEVIAAVTEAASAGAMPYGNDPWTARVSARLRDVFECDLWAFPVATGTAANALALSAICPPFGTVFCHPASHANTDECGAPEFYTGGAKLTLVDGPDGKIDPAALTTAIETARPHGVHNMPPAAVTITQESEAGTVYAADHVDAIADIAKKNKLALHMDGARFANALAALDVSAADATWRRGVDVLSFGATKNGAMAAEAVVFFDPDMAEDFLYRRKRGGHLFSKMRYLSAQLVAYLQDDLWLENARHANACAQTLSQGLAALDGAHLVHPVQANEIFVTLPERVLNALKTASVGFHSWGNEGLSRFVCAFNTDAADVERTLKIAQAAI